MGREKFKRDYLPDLRNLTKDLEDVIIDKNEVEEKKVIMKLEIVLRKIRKSRFIDS